MTAKHLAPDAPLSPFCVVCGQFAEPGKSACRACLDRATASILAATEALVDRTERPTGVTHIGNVKAA